MFKNSIRLREIYAFLNPKEGAVMLWESHLVSLLKVGEEPTH